MRVTIEMPGEYRPVKTITGEHLLELRNELLTGYQCEGRKHSVIKKGRSVATVNGCMSDLYAIFKFALDNGYITKNLVANISILRKERKKPDPLTREEFPRVIQCCKNRQIANLWSLAVLTGLRHGELCALAWEDIDLQQGYLMVNLNLTKAGARHRKAYQSRHTIACWSLAVGANPNYVAAQMGHANSPIVYLVCGTWMQENNDEQVSLINSKFADVALHMPYRKASGR